MVTQNKEASFEEWRARTNAMRQDFVNVAERYLATSGEQFPPGLVAYTLLELGVRLCMTVHQPQQGATEARRHVEAIIAICEAQEQGNATH